MLADRPTACPERGLNFISGQVVEQANRVLYLDIIDSIPSWLCMETQPAGAISSSVSCGDKLVVVPCFYQAISGLVTRG